MAHGYSGAGAVFQMPASATDVDVLCSRSCYCRPFSSFFPLSWFYLRLVFWFCVLSFYYVAYLYSFPYCSVSPSLPFAIFVRL